MSDQVKYNRLSAEKLAEMESATKKRAEQMARAAAEKKRIAETPLTRSGKTTDACRSRIKQSRTIRQTLDKLAAKVIAGPGSGSCRGDQAAFDQR